MFHAKRIILIAVLPLALGCANMSRQTIEMDHPGDVIFRVAGSYNLDLLGAVIIDGGTTIPISGVPIPIQINVASQAMFGTSNIKISNASSVLFEIMATGNQNGGGYEYTSTEEHLLIGDHGAELESEFHDVE